MLYAGNCRRAELPPWRSASWANSHAFLRARLIGWPFRKALTTLPEFWALRVRAAAARWPTPFYLAAWERVEPALVELARIEMQYPLRHWLSVKTQPLKPLLRSWAARGWGAEVVSEFELRAAIAEGFTPQNILVN